MELFRFFISLKINKMLVGIEDVLNHVVKSHDVKVEGDGHSAISKIEELPTYIHPKLKELKRVENYKPVLIFSAPGAVGKTTFAKYFSCLKNSYYWDLSKLKLGDNTFIGTIAKHFGHQNLGDILTKLSNGQLSFFFDGFDEAEMISGLDGIYSFVKEIHQTVKHAPFPAVIFFSRTETVEWIKLTLEEIQTKESYSLYEIEYFDELGAKDFVKHVLESQNDLSFKSHKETFGKALQNIFYTIGQGLNVPREQLWSNEKTKSFLGYSPVLQTIAQYLVGQNYFEVQQEFEGGSHLEGVELVRRFADSLLAREQKKVVDALKQNTNSPSGFNWEIVYSPKIQIMCVFTYLNEGCQINSLSSLIEGPDWLDRNYLEAINQFLPNHPFIRNNKFANTSFQDYTLAVLAEDELFKSEVLHYLKGNGITSILFTFYYKSLYQSVFSPEYAGFLYEAVLSGLQLDSNAAVQLDFVDDSKQIELTLSYQDGSGKYEVLTFKSDAIDIPIVFYRKLHNADLFTQSTIEFNGLSNSIELRDVNVSAQKMILNARLLLLNCYDESSVVMIADEFLNRNHQIRIEKIGDGEVQVQFPHSNKFPWSQYNDNSLSREIIDENAMASKVYATRLILSPFRKHKKGIFGKQHEYIENVIVKDNPIRREVFEKMIQSGILHKRSNEPIYELNDEKLQKHGINWGEIKALKQNEKLIKFLS